MDEIYGVSIVENSLEETIPDFAADFPCRRSTVIMQAMPAYTAAWHWHPAFELIYLESGTLRYETPHQSVILEAGEGAFVNAQVLHQSQALSPDGAAVVRVHLFDPILLAGFSGSRMESCYILPVVQNRSLEMVPLFRSKPENDGLLRELKASFQLDAQAFGYEMQLRNALSSLWLSLFPRLLQPDNRTGISGSEEAARKMLQTIQTRWSEDLSVADLAASAALSERECYRVFRQLLHTTPAACLRQHRLSKAAQMLTYTDESVTAIAHACGLGSSSALSRLFQPAYGCSPGDYRRRQKMSPIRQESDSR